MKYKGIDKNSIVVSHYGSFQINELIKISKIDTVEFIAGDGTEIDMTLKGNKIFVENLPIGKYTLRVNGYTQFKRNGDVSEKYIYIIYNPEDEKENTFISVNGLKKFQADNEIMQRSKVISDMELIDEYVLQEANNLYKFNDKKHKVINWKFDQDDFIVISTLMTLLDKHISVKDREDISKVLRVITNLVCGPESVFHHRSDEIRCHWKSTSEVMKAFVQNKMKPLDSSESWVYCGVLTSFLRAIGIPSRIVINFCTLDEGDKHVIIGKYPLNNDIIWNYHCWVECWCTRHDLEDSDLSGWQTLDPKMTGKKKDIVNYFAGPYPVNAIRHSSFDVKYETRNITSCINYSGEEKSVSIHTLTEFGDEFVDVSKNYNLKIFYEA